MPIETMPMSAQQRTQAGTLAYEDPQNKPTARETFTEGFIDQSAWASWLAETERMVDEGREEGYDQFKDIPDDLIDLPLGVWEGANSPIRMASRIADVRTQMERNEALANGNWFAGTAGQIAGFITSPEVAGTIGLAGTGMRGVSMATRVAKGSMLGAAGDILNEAALHDVQEMRTRTQTAINIAAASLLTGLVSGAFGKTVARPTTKFVYQDLDETFNNHGMRSVGSASYYDYESERILNKPWVTSAMLSPMRPLAASKSAESLHWFSNLWEHSYTLGKTEQGRAQQIAMETVAEREIQVLVRQTNKAVNSGYKAYIGAESNFDAVRGVIRNRGQRQKFQEAVHRAMVNEDRYVGDASISQAQRDAIENTAKALRSNVYERTLELAKQAGLADPEDFAVKFAKSYAPRRWNRTALIQQESEFKEVLTEAYKQDTAKKRLAQVRKETTEASEKAQKELVTEEERLVGTTQKFKAASDEAAAAESAERTTRARLKEVERQARAAESAARKAEKKARRLAKQTTEDAKGKIAAPDREASRLLVEDAERQAKEYQDVVADLREELKAIREEINARKQAEREEGFNVAEPEPRVKEGNVKPVRVDKGNRAEPEPVVREGNVAKRSPEEIREAQRVEDLKEALDEARYVAKEAREAAKELRAANASKEADADEFIIKAQARLAKADKARAKSLLTMAKQIRRVRTAQRKLWRAKQFKVQSRVQRLSARARLLAREREIAANKIADEFIPVTETDIRYIKDAVQETFEKLAYGYDADVYMSPVGRRGFGSPWKERVIPLEDNFLLDKGWLESNMEAMTLSHINHMVKPSFMKMYAGDPDLVDVIGSIGKHYDGLIENAENAVREATDPKIKAKRTKELRRLTQEKVDNIKMHELMRDRWYGRTAIPNTRAGAMINDYLRALRNVNTTLMMGMVLPTSLGDVARWNMATIYAPELGAMGGDWLKAFKTMKLSKEEWQKIGIANEVASFIRTAKIVDGSDIIGTHGAQIASDMAVHASGAAAKALMKATFLAHWTDFGKLLSAGYVQNDLIQKAIGYDLLKPQNKALLARMGIDEQMAKTIRSEVERGLQLTEADRGINRINAAGMDNKAYATQVNFDNWADQEAARKFQDILFRESERSIVTPRTGDMPMFLGDTELGRSIAQFTSFLFAAVQQVGVPIGKRMRYDLDPKAYRLGMQMVMGGMFSVLIRHAVQGRLDEMEDWTPMDWVLNGVDYSGTVPLQMYAFNGINMLSKGGLAGAIGATTMTRYAHRPNMAVLMGPTAGTIENFGKVAQIPFSEDGLTESEMRQLRRVMLWNNLPFMYIPFEAMEQQVVEQ
jgi:hypothetical protein